MYPAFARCADRASTHLYACLEAARHIHENDYVELTQSVDKVEGTGQWPSGTRGTVVAEHDQPRGWNGLAAQRRQRRQVAEHRRS
jgi:hypothetical protein